MCIRVSVHLVFGEAAHIGAFQVHHPRIAAQGPCELAVADVHTVDLRRAAAEHAVGKTAGGRAHIHAHRVREIQPERLYGAGELEPAAADIGAGFTAQLDCRVGGDERARLVHPLAGHIYKPRHQRALRALPALRKAALHE